MLEIHNPDVESRNPGGNRDARFRLAILGLAFIVFFGLQYIWQTKPYHSNSSQSGTAASSACGDRQGVLVHGCQGDLAASPGNFGWLTFIAKPLYLALRFLHDHGIGNWGWSIIVLTAIFNLVVIWPRMMSMKSSLKMMRVQPKVDALKKRYAHLKINDPKRAEMNAEMMALYKAEGANMLVVACLCFYKCPCSLPI